jgi:hypothetical protein
MSLNANVCRGPDRRRREEAKPYLQSDGSRATRAEARIRQLEVLNAMKKGWTTANKKHKILQGFRATLDHIALNLPRAKLTGFHGIPEDVFRRMVRDNLGITKIPRTVSSGFIQREALVEMRNVMKEGAFTRLPRLLLPHGKREWFVDGHSGISLSVYIYVQFFYKV